MNPQRNRDIRVPSYTPAPLNRNQASLEGLIDLSDDTPQPLPSEERESAKAILEALLASYRNNLDNIDSSPRYNRPYLIELVFNHAVEPVGCDNFLRYFFTWLISSSSSEDATPDLPSESQFHEALSELLDFQQWNHDRQVKMLLRVKDFSDHLIFAFFIPLKASGGKTPKASARSSSTSSPVAGTHSRLATLREDCLLRDHHRCVIRRTFLAEEYINRYKKYGSDAKDDDGRLFSDLNSEEMTSLEVAHIIPHSFVSLNPGETELNDSKINALTILEMFAPGIKRRIEGAQIDRPFNAISLSPTQHDLFGALHIYFHEIQDSPPHTYAIKSFVPLHPFPVVRTLLSSPSRPVDMPDRQLLAIHKACAMILHLSGAGDYIERLLDSFGGGTANADGLSDLGSIVSLRMHSALHSSYGRA